MEEFSDNVVDLCINTISMSEMTNDTQNYYLNNIERITKDYFYSVNRPKKREEKYNAQGFIAGNLKKIGKLNCIIFLTPIILNF